MCPSHSIYVSNIARQDGFSNPLCTHYVYIIYRRSIHFSLLLGCDPSRMSSPLTSDNISLCLVLHNVSSALEHSLNANERFPLQNPIPMETPAQRE